MKLQIDEIYENKEIVNLILENITSAVFMVDNDVRISDLNYNNTIIFNKSASKMIGELCGNAIGCINQFFYQLDCGKTPKCPECKIRKSVLRTFIEKVPTKTTYLKRTFIINNEPVDKSLLFSTIPISFKISEMALVIVDDVTGYEKQKEAAIKLSEEKNRLIGIAAHDLRSPISVIQMYAKTYLDLYKNNMNTEQIQFLDVIFNKSKFMISLINDILDVTKIESGIEQIDKKKIDYLSFVDNIISNSELVAKKKDITLILKESIGHIEIMIDEFEIERVITNLIDNAIKYSNRGSKVTIILSKDDNYIKTEIIDEGVGISKEKQKNLFKPFISLISAGTEGEKSVGLGLNIAKKLVNMHNGSIDVISDEGKGSNFYFTLPIE